VPAPDLEPLVSWGRSLGLAGEPEQVSRRPWSTTARLGTVWLKACGPGARYEAALLGALLWWGAPSTVLPVAVDAAQGYAALPDGGPQLRSLGTGTAAWPALLAEHADLQRRLQRHADDAVGLGVPDLRPERLPEELEALLQRTPLTSDLLRAVAAVLPEVRERCAALAAGPVAATVQHDDLHDGNLLVDAAGVARVIDWGDCSVGHPFGVLLVTLRALGSPVRHAADRAGAAAGLLPGGLDRPGRPLHAGRAGRARTGRAGGRPRAVVGEGAVAADEPERAAWGDPVSGWLEVLAGLDD
jgi:hypothetical protein